MQHQESASALSSSSSSSSMWAIMNSWFTPTVLFVLLNLIIGVIAYTSSLTNHKHSRNKPNHHQQKITDSPSLLQRLKLINSQSYHHQSQESQNSSLNHRPNQDFDTPFDSDNTVLTRSLETPFAQESHYIFHENLQSQVHQIFSETHELNYLETSAHFVPNQKGNTFDYFQLPNDENVLQGGDPNTCEDFGEGSRGDFIRTESETDFSQSHEQNHQENNAPFALNVKGSIFDDLQLAHEEKVVEDHEENVNEVSSEVKGSNFTRTTSDIASLKSGLGHLEAEEIRSVEARRPKTMRERGSSKATDGDAEVDSKADDFINKFKHQLKLQRLDSIVRYGGVIARGSGGGK